MKTRTMHLGEMLEIEKGKKTERLLNRPSRTSRRYLQIDDLRPGAKPKFAEPFACPLATPADVIIAWDGANAGTVSCNLNGFIGSTLAILRANSETVFPAYLSRFLESKFDYLQANATGATIPHISKDALERLELPLPSLPDQRRIAARLEQADRLRRTRRYALELSDDFLPAAFLEMFGEPASNERGHPLQMVEELFPTGREGSKCGPFGSALRNDEYTPAGIPVWTMENIAGGEFREEGSLYISPAKYDELKSYTVQNGDILISRAGTVGRMAILATKHERSIIHSNLVRLTLDLQRCLPIYFTVLMKYFGSAIGRLKRGAEDAYSFMNTGRISELRIPVPPLPLQRRFAELVAEHERLRAMQREALRQAEHLFQTLLHNAFADGAA